MSSLLKPLLSLPFGLPVVAKFWLAMPDFVDDSLADYLASASFCLIVWILCRSPKPAAAWQEMQEIAIG
ncbi:hypothetical protein [Synechococcus sp. MW101C3]|uniref:hypothetical protein n=1 Tax=Synechococcus sp. MW101C3 TaxID=210768 RepID=UPI001181AB1A|nr:hypothetical protein [Synechococcus sp. MW101C3]